MGNWWLAPAGSRHLFVYLVMKHPLNALAEYFHLSNAQYWHLRLLSAVAVVPLLVVLYLAIRFYAKRRSSE